MIYNNVEGGLSGTLAGAATSIPSIGITQADGAALASSVGAFACSSRSVSCIELVGTPANADLVLISRRKLWSWA